jgi:hypothetical protein
MNDQDIITRIEGRYLTPPEEKEPPEMDEQDEYEMLALAIVQNLRLSVGKGIKKKDQEAQWRHAIDLIAEDDDVFKLLAYRYRNKIQELWREQDHDPCQF